MRKRKNPSEIWKPVNIEYFKDYYEVSNKGRVRSLSREIEKNLQGKTNYLFPLTGRIKKPNINTFGYYQIQLYANRNFKTMLVHRIVGLTFIENPENKQQINHKDGNKLNNAVSNLEWCTNSENQLHSYNVLKGRKREKPKGKNSPYSKKVIQCNVSGQIIQEWDSLSIASKNTKIRLCCISAATRGIQKTAGNYIWKLAKSEYCG